MMRPLVSRFSATFQQISAGFPPMSATFSHTRCPGQATVPVDAPLPPRPDTSLSEPERLTEAARQSSGNLAQAARLLGLSRGGLRYSLRKYGLDRLPPDDASALARPQATMPTVDVLVAPAGDPSVLCLTPPDVAPARAGPAVGWEPQPVAVLAIKTTWLDRSEAGARPNESRTLASRWEERLAEKVAGFGGVIPQGAPSLCLVAFR